MKELSMDEIERVVTEELKHHTTQQGKLTCTTDYFAQHIAPKLQALMDKRVEGILSKVEKAVVYKMELPGTGRPQGDKDSTGGIVRVCEQAYVIPIKEIEALKSKLKEGG